MTSILKRSPTSFLLMVLNTSACIVAREARTKAKLSTDIIRSYDKSGLAIVDFGATVKSDCGGGNGGADDEKETGKMAVTWSTSSSSPN